MKMYQLRSGLMGTRGAKAFAWAGWPDLLKALIVALVAGIGAVLTSLTEWVSGQDFGQWTPLIFVAWATIAEALRRWLLDFSDTVEINLANQPESER